jgi:hypothetical protein
MRVIQSFIPTPYQKDFEVYLRMSELSVNSIRKHYKELTLYTTPEVAELVKKRGIQYSTIDVDLFKESSSVPLGNYAIPKILCYLAQEQPFLHLDYDVVLLNKLNITQDFLIGYYDFDLVSRETKPTDLNRLHDYYLKDLTHIHEYLPIEVQNTVDLRVLPNFSIFGVKNLRLNKAIYQSILEFYNKNIEIFKKLNHTPSMVEQFLFTVYLTYYLNREKTVEESINIVEKQYIKPQEYLNGNKHFANFLHLQSEKYDSEFLIKLDKYLNDK